MNNEKLNENNEANDCELLVTAALKAIQNKCKSKRRARVELEPELEEIAALWSAAKRFEMARKFGRWARQLKVSGFILFHDSHRFSQPRLQYVGLRKARLN